MNGTQSDTAMAVVRFLDAGPREPDFPFGGAIPIPTDSELALAMTLSTGPALTLNDVEHVKRSLNMRRAYSLAIFATRMAIHAARTKKAATLGATIGCLMIDNGDLDWRDVLTSLSIMEHCAVRIGMDFRSVVEGVLPLASDERRATVIDGYLSRDPKMRDIGVMGITSSGDGAHLTFNHRL